MLKRYLYLCLLIFLCCNLAFAEKYHFHTLKNQQESLLFSTLSIWQDHIGRIWLGNDMINCYDGTTIKSYRMSDYFAEIEDEDIHDLCGDDSVMYFLVSNRLAYLDLATSKFTLTKVKASSIKCYDGLVYYVNHSAFYHYNRTTDESTLLMNLTDGKISYSYIMRDDEDTMLVGTSVGLYSIKNKSRKIVRKDLDNESISFIFKDSQSNIWVTCKSGRIYIRNKSGDYILQKIKNNTNSPSYSGDNFRMTEDGTGDIWLGTLSGIYIISISQNEEDCVELNDYILPSSFIFSLFKDRQGSIWVGSYYGDVKYTNPMEKYISYKTEESREDQLHGYLQGKMCIGENGDLYVATQGSGINVISRSHDYIRHLDLNSGLPNRIIDDIWYDKETGRLFFTSFTKGIYYMDMKTRGIHQIQSPLLKIAEHKIIKEIFQYKNYLILETQDGLFKLDRKTLEISPFLSNPELHKLCSTVIRTFYIDENDVLWVSLFKEGLVSIDLKKQKVLRRYGNGQGEKDMLASAVTDIAGDERYGMYLATLKSGVMYYVAERDTFLQFSAKNNELLSDVIFSIAISRYGTLVVTSNEGISFVDLTAKREFKTSYHMRISSLSPLRGLNRDCGIYTSKDSDVIIIGGIDGLLFLNEKYLGNPSKNYNLLYSSLYINGNAVSCAEMFGKELYELDEIALPSGSNTLSFTFASSNYQSPMNYTEYEYMLKGLDSYWIKTDHHTITYNSLPAGHYKLIVREYLNHDKSIELNVVIKPPFWRSWIAILIYLVVGSVLFLWIYRFNKSKITLKLSLDMKKNELARIEEINQNKIKFITNISNEFRTPLMLIATIVNRMENDMSSPKIKIEKIKSQISRLLFLLTELTDFKKIEQNSVSLNIDRHNLDGFLKDIHSSYKEYADDRQIVFRYNSTAKEHYLWFDHLLMQKVFYNLLTEVFKWTKPGEEVNMSFMSEKDRTIISIKTLGAELDSSAMAIIDQMITTPISNDNESISIANISKIWLTYSKSIIYLHNGELKFGKENGYISMNIILRNGNNHFKDNPVSQERVIFNLSENVEESEIESNDHQVELSPNQNDKDFTLVLIESNDMERNLLKESFSLTYEVVDFDNTQSGYEYVMENKVDIIICAVNTVNMSGIELCNKLKANIKTMHIPIILTTSNPSTQQEKDAIRSGANDYIIKPFNVEIFLLRCNAMVTSSKNIQSVYSKSNMKKLTIVGNEEDKKFVDEINRVLEENYSNVQFDTSYWSHELGISRTKLFNRIKDVTGMTPNDYIIAKKMDHAMYLFNEKSTRTVSEVAYSLGFSNPAYFSKYFKKKYGLTPQEYKKQNGSIVE